MGTQLLIRWESWIPVYVGLMDAEDLGLDGAVEKEMDGLFGKG